MREKDGVRGRKKWPLMLFGLATLTLAMTVTGLLFAGLAAAWHSIGVFIYLPASYGFALATFALLWIGFAGCSPRLPTRVIVLVFLAAFALIASAHFAAFAVAGIARDRAVRRAVDAGLEADCRAIFKTYERDSRIQKDGYARIFHGTPEFNKLPASIRGLRPVYITIEDHPYDSEMPRNIGVCKNGFGGFAFGVRVFLEDEQVPPATWSREVSPNVYLWQEET